MIRKMTLLVLLEKFVANFEVQNLFQKPVRAPPLRTLVRVEEVFSDRLKFVFGSGIAERIERLVRLDLACQELRPFEADQLPPTQSHGQSL